MFKYLKTFGLLILTNILVVLTISTLLNVLGVKHYLDENGLNYESLLIFCFIWGMGGAFISLLISKWMAKMAMGVKVIDPTKAGEYAWLVQMVHDISRKAGLQVMPEVGIFDTPAPNAFATGPTKNNSLVACSTGLLRQMNHEEVRGVVGHEVAHIANGDMVTMTLIQGVVNAFVMALSRIIAFVISNSGRNSDREGYSSMNYLLVFVLELVLGLFGMMVVAWFSRQREFRADAGSAHYVGKRPMIGGLKSLQRVYHPTLASIAESAPNSSMQALMISGKSGGFLSLFASHPPLDERIKRLEAMQIA
jgi:heat shock protein HtpX